ARGSDPPAALAHPRAHGPAGVAPPRGHALGAGRCARRADAQPGGAALGPPRRARPAAHVARAGDPLSPPGLPPPDAAHLAARSRRSPARRDRRALPRTRGARRATTTATKAVVAVAAPARQAANPHLAR